MDRVRLLFFLLCPLTLMAENPGAEKDTLIYDYIFLTQRFQNKFTFYGRDFGQKIPFLNSGVMYYFHSNVWLNVSGFYFFNSQIPIQPGASLGYLADLSPKTEFNISYTQYFSKGGKPLKGLSQGFAQTSLGLDWKIMFSTLQVQAMFSDSSDYFITTQHSRYFVFNEKLWDKIKISFEPKISFTWGTNQFAYQYQEIAIGPGSRTRPPQAQGKPPASKPNPLPGNGGTFKFLNWDFVFPLTFEWYPFQLETSFRYTHPYNMTDLDISSPTFVFGAELTYYIPVKKHRKLPL